MKTVSIAEVEASLSSYIEAARSVPVVITKDGRIAHKHIGPLTRKDIEETILPLVRRLR